MASVSPATGTIDVLVISGYEERRHMFSVSRDATVWDLKRRWEAHFRLPEGSIIRSIDGSRLDDYLQLSDIDEGDGPPSVLIEETIVLNVEIYKGKIDERKFLSVSLSSKPEDLHPQIGRMFDLGEDRFFRLRTRDWPLLYGVSLERQNLETGIFVDIGYEFHVTDEWTSAVVSHLMFASEDAADLGTEEEVAQRMLLDGIRMNVHHDILNAVPLYYRGMTDVIVHHHQQKDITLMVNDFFKQKFVWPTDVAGQLISHCPPLTSNIYFEERRCPPDVTMKKLQVPSGAVVHAKTCMTVQLSSGKFKVLRIADMGTVADVEAMVSAEEGTTRFVLTSRGRSLKSSEKISTISDVSNVVVKPRGDAVSVLLRDRSVRFFTDQRKMDFSQVMRSVAEKGQVKYKKLVKMTLQCQGCGRRIWKEEEAFQTVPSNCCRVRSLILTDATPLKVRDTGMQGAWPVRQKQFGEGHLQTGVKQQATIMQACETIPHPPPGVQQQTVKMQVSKTIQHPPPALFPLRIQNPANIGRRQDFSTDLLLNARPSVWQVRNAVAASMAVPPRTVRLTRPVVRHQKFSERVFYGVYDDRRGKWAAFRNSLGGLFADQEGKTRPYFGGESSNLQLISLELMNDFDIFFFIPGWRNRIQVLKSPEHGFA